MPAHPLEVPVLVRPVKPVRAVVRRLVPRLADALRVHRTRSVDRDLAGAAAL
jgi:hypothetical protein